jgi:CRISPR-associated protein Csx10
VTTRYLPYTLSLNAPLVATVPGGDPNSARTLRYVPGAAIRGAVARALGDPAAGTPRWPDLQRLVLGDMVRYLNAYPLAVGRRALPAPVSWMRSKHRAGRNAERLHDLAAYDGRPADDHEIHDHWPDEQLDHWPGEFATLGAPEPATATVAVGGRIHQQRDRVRGRSWTDERTGEAHGTVFGYESLDAGQRFGGLILVRGDSDGETRYLTDRLGELLGRPILLGRSRQAGYGGQATVAWGEPRDREVRGEGVIDGDVAPGAEFRLLLTSPYLGRDPATGQPDPGRLCGELRAELGEHRVEVRWVRWSFGQAGGYNRRWGLALPQRLAAAAGSVVSLRALTDLPSADLINLEHRGLGERRVDGFGRCVFLTAPDPSVRVQPPPATTPQPRPDGQAPRLVSTIQARIAAARVALAIEEAAAAIARSAGPLPTPSLLGRLRVPLRRSYQQGVGELRQWLDGPAEARLRRPAARQLERCRLTTPDGRPTTLVDWLRAMTSDTPPALAPLLGLDALIQQAYVVSEASLRSWLDASADQHRSELIDAVLAALERRYKQATRENPGD